jgi:hypothetical protein
LTNSFAAVITLALKDEFLFKRFECMLLLDLDLLGGVRDDDTGASLPSGLLSWDCLCDWLMVFPKQFGGVVIHAYEQGRWYSTSRNRIKEKKFHTYSGGLKN